jgi:hypothetical protein
MRQDDDEIKLSLLERFTLTPVLLKENRELKLKISELESKIDESREKLNTNDDVWRQKFLDFSEKIFNQVSELLKSKEPEVPSFILTPEEEVVAKQKLSRQLSNQMVGAMDIMDRERERWLQQYNEEENTRKESSNISESRRQELVTRARELSETE